MLPKFNEIESIEPDLDSLSQTYSQFRDLLSDPQADPHPTIEHWDKLRREIMTWQHLAELNFERETNNAQFIATREKCDQISPQLLELDIGIKKRILEGPHRENLKSKLGEQAFAIWNSEILSFQSDIKHLLVTESQVSSDYSALLASAELEFNGETYNHEGIDQFKFSPDRETRVESMRVKWKWFELNAEKLDAQFDRLVDTRHSMAQALGYADYLELGYFRRCRVDYGREEVESYRQQVQKHVVPFCEKWIANKADTLCLERVMFWDEAIHTTAGNPKPKGDHDWMIKQAETMFDSMSDSIGTFFKLMVDRDLLDLKNRPAKGGGGFCTDFPQFGLPYIFANFNGSADDVRVFTHEIGHAYQGFSSREQPIYDYIWPTYESCEIHSMGLEFLTFPFMNLFFGAESERFCREHLIDSLLFLPYGVAVDHFQHLVYSNPSASADDRRQMWQEMESAYLPWRDYGDLPYLTAGGRWQLQRHIFMYPLYYIDYTLALVCALQLWQRSLSDFSGTLTEYEELCQRGGTLPFQQLLQSANLNSPFDPGVLSTCIETAEEWLKG